MTETSIEENLVSHEELNDYFDELFNKAEQVKMIYKLNQEDIKRLTGRKGKLLIITKSEEDSLEVSKYLYMSDVPQYLVDKEDSI